MEPAARTSSWGRLLAVTGCVGLFVAGALWLAKGLQRDERTGTPTSVAGEPRPTDGGPPSAPASLATAPRPPAPPPSSAAPVPPPNASPPAPPGDPSGGAPQKPRQGSRVAGVVVHPDGTPVGGVTVWAEPADGGKRSRVYARTGADGAYLLEGLPAGRWRVQVRRADRVVEIETVDVSGATDVEHRVARGELPPPSAAWLAATVRVLGPDGKPVPFARVAVLLAQAPERGPTGAAGFGGFADFEDGLFYRGGPERTGTTYLVFAAAPSPSGTRLGYAPARFVAEKPADGQVELRLEVGPTIEGRVEDEDGKGVAGIPVEAYPPEAVVGKAGTSPQLPLHLDEAVSDPSGAFVLRGVGTGPVLVVAHGQPPFVRAGPSTTVPGGARAVRLVLRKGVEARVTVLDPAGQPVAKATVDAGIPFLKTNDEGVLVLTGLDPAADTILRVSPPLSRADLRPTALSPWKPADVTVRLERGHHLKGRIVGPDGTAGVPGTVQHLVGTDWKPVAGTQRDGTFELRGMPEGPWTLRASGFTPDSPKGPQVVVRDESTEVRLVLPAAPAWPTGR